MDSATDEGGMTRALSCVLAAALLACATAACGGGGSGAAISPLASTPQPTPTPTGDPQPSPSVDPSLKIQHVVIIVQENRSFDNMFNGYPGADTAQSGKMSNGQTVALTQISLSSGLDLRHRHYTWWTSWDGGKMDGFDIDRAPQNPAWYPYQYVHEPDIDPYWQLAAKYTLADRMFQSSTSGSYPAHLYLIAGQSAQVIGNPSALPWGCDAPRTATVTLVGPDGTEEPGPFPCFNYATLASLMDARGIRWRYYSPMVTQSGGIWSAFDSITQVRNGVEWSQDVISPETRVLQDVAAGQLAQVTWVVPSGINSDHPGNLSSTGPQWVGSIVNAIGNSPFWNSTAIFVLWDDWGGWYDHVDPPQLDDMGLGFRVPLLVVSPYAKHGYVSHVQHEFGSLLRFTEENFGLPTLGQSDARSDDLADCFDFSQSPQPFAHVATRLGASYFIAHSRDESLPDDDL